MVVYIGVSMAENIIFWQEKYGESIAPSLTPVEIELRDLFVKEYLKDFDAVLAAVRCGFSKTYAEQYANQFWFEPYVQNKIAEAQRNIANDEELEKQNFALLVNTLTRAMQNGPYASRVSAAKELKSLYGWESQPKENEEDSLVKALREFAAKAPV